MATCVIECTPELQKRVGSNSNNSSSIAAASLRPMAMPTEFSLNSLNNKPGTSAFQQRQIHHQQQRGIKRRSGTSTSSWTDDDSAATILSMSNQFSTSSISGGKATTISRPIITSSNDPSDILLHQLSQVCEQAQKTAAFSGEQSKPNKLTINTVLESDRNSSTLKTTKLANHFISCFIVGGEIRLCSSQIHAVIMKDVHEDDIFHWIRELNIIDHMASQEQITSLKLNRAIPPESGICGLMTKTNAERLVGALIDPVNYRTLPNEKKDKFEPILIEHDCFGGCEGRLYSSLFPGPCIECIQCKCLMTTESFCRHSHIISPSETSVPLCHWGFDAANWSKYIRLHQLVEGDQESANRFYSLLKSCNSFDQQEDTLEDNLEVYAKKQQPMISAPLSALAALAQLQSQQQQQQQFQGIHQQPSSSSSAAIAQGNGIVSAPSSLPNSSFIPPSSLSQCSTASGSTTNLQQSNGILPSSLPNAAAAPTNANSLSQLLSSIQQQQLLGQLQNILTQQPQQASPNHSLLAMLQQAHIQQQQQQQQFQSTINTLRNNAGGQMNDDSDIPRKRAHTISDPSSATIRTKPDEFSLSSISFGMLQSDQQILSILAQVTEGETFRRATELVNLSIAQRVQPIVEDNARLRRELQQAQEELKNKNDVLAKLAVAHVQQLQQQQQRNNQFPTITTPSSLIPGSSTSSLFRNQHHPPQIAEQDSDIEIDDVSTL